MGNLIKQQYSRTIPFYEDKLGMFCSGCGRTFGLMKLSDDTFMCPKCKSDSHIYDEEGRCWCQPELVKYDDGDGIWLHNLMV